MAKKNDVTAIAMTDSIKKKLIEAGIAENMKDNPLWNLFVDGYDAKIIDTYLENNDIVNLLRDWYALVQFGNKFVDLTQPWVTAKTDKEIAQQDLIALLWLIKNINLLSSAFLVE